MKNILNSIFALALIGVLSCFQLNAKELMTSEKLLQVKRLSGFKISNDGNKIVYGISIPDLEANSSKTQLYIMNSDGKESKQLTTNGTYNGQPVWTADSKSIYFLSNRSGSMQAWQIELRGGEAKQITNIEDGISNFSVSPDGKKFAFTQEIKLDENIHDKYKDLPKAKAYVYDKLPVRHWDEWIDDKFSHLFIMDVNTKELTDIMLNEKFDTPLKPFGGSEQIAWSPDSKEIAYTSRKVVNYAFSTNSDIYIYNLADKTTKNISEGMNGYDLQPIYSPDGSKIAFLSQERAGFESDRIRLMIYDRNSKKIEELTKDLDQWVHNPVWSHDSKSIYFTAGNFEGSSQIYSINVLDGKFKIISKGLYNWGDQGIDANETDIFVTRRNYNRPSEIYSISLENNTDKQISHLNDDLFAGIEECTFEAKWVKSSDGSKVHTWVIYPPNFDKNKKYPLITYCQGGPQQAVDLFFSYGWNFLLMASEGYVIVAPNRRGCPGFGQDWVDAMSKDYGGKPMQDILAATDAMANEKYIDKNKMSAIGASAGGYTVFWLAGNHENRFSAFVSHCGMFDMVSKYGSTEELFFPNWDNGGPYWEKKSKSFYEKHSPHVYADKWNTPILIITGEKDYRVPYTQSLEAFTVAQSKGIPSKLISYPNENHWVMHPQEQLLWNREFFEFLDKYCKSKK